MSRGEILELPETPDAGVDGAGKGAHRHLEFIAGVDHQRVGRRDQRVPVGRVDIDSDLAGRIGRGVAESDDLFLQADLQALERHGRGMRVFQLEVVEPAAEQRAVAQLPDQFGDGALAARDGAVDALMRQQHAAFQLQASAKRPQRLPELAEVGQGCKLVKSGNGEATWRRFIRGVGQGKDRPRSGAGSR